MKMNIDQLALEIAADQELTQAQAKAVVRQIFSAISENIAEGHEVHVPDFGKFRRKDRPQRQGRNPKTGETMTIAAKSVPNFLAAKGLKEACNS